MSSNGVCLDDVRRVGYYQRVLGSNENKHCFNTLKLHTLDKYIYDIYNKQLNPHKLLVSNYMKKRRVKSLNSQSSNPQNLVYKEPQPSLPL